MKNDLLSQLRARAAHQLRRIVFPEAEDPRILQAARVIADRKMAIPILAGTPDRITEKARTLGMNLSGIDIVKNDIERSDRYASMLQTEWRAKGVTEVEARERLRNPMYFATA